MSTNAPPIHEPWLIDKKTGKLVSMPWILWLQQVATEISSPGVQGAQGPQGPQGPQGLAA